MIHCLLVLLAIRSAAAAAIVSTRAGHELRLTMPMLRALDQWDPGFRPFREREYTASRWCLDDVPHGQAPFAAIGDFNGDHLPDVAVHGLSRSDEVVIALLSDSSGIYRVHEIKRFRRWAAPGQTARDLETLIQFTPAGTHFTGAFAGYPLTLRHDAFEVVYCDKASELYYWNGTKFKQYVTGD